MKKFLMVLLASTGVASATTFNELNNHFNQERFNLLKNIHVPDQRFQIQNNLKKHAGALDIRLSAKPTTNSRASVQERCEALTSMAHKALFQETGWLEPEKRNTWDAENSHLAAIWIMKESVKLLISDPFSLISNNIYKDLSQKLQQRVTPAFQTHDYFKVGSLKHLIPQEFLNRFVKMMVNINGITNPEKDDDGSMTPLSWRLKGKSVEALVVMALKNPHQTVTLDPEEGLLCLPPVGEDHWQRQEITIGTTYKISETQKDNNTIYELKMNDKSYGVEFKKLEIDKKNQEIQKLFYDDQQLKGLNYIFRLGYYFTASPFTSYYTETGFSHYLLPTPIFLAEIIARYGTLAPLSALTYLSSSPSFSLIPLSLREEKGELEKALAHPILKGIDVSAFKANLEKQSTNLMLSETTKAEYKYVKMCQWIEENPALSFAEALEKWYETKRREEEEALRFKEVKKNEERLQRLLNEKNQIKEILLRDIAVNDIKFSLFEAYLTLLTDKVDHAKWQQEKNQKIDSITLTPEEVEQLKKRVEEFIQLHSLKGVSKQLQAQVANLFMQEFNKGCNEVKRYINNNLDAPTLKETAAIMAKTKVGESEWEKLLQPLRRRSLPNNLINPANLAQEKDQYVQQNKLWNNNEEIMNVGEFLKSRYKSQNISTIQTADIDLCLETLGKELGLQPGKHIYTGELTHLPFLKDLTSNAKNEIINSNHLNQKDFQTNNLTRDAQAMRADFIKVVNYLSMLEELYNQPNALPEQSLEKLELLKTQFHAYMEDQVGRCCTGLKSRLFLAKLDMATLLKELYEEGYDFSNLLPF